MRVRQEKSMPYTTHKLPDEPIAILYVDHALTSRAEGIQMSRDIYTLLQQSGDHLHLILDYRDLDMSIGVIILSLAAALIGSGEEAIKLSDPRLHVRIVGSNGMARLWAMAMRQEQYGGQPTPLFDTVDEALEHARAAEADLVGSLRAQPPAETD